MKVLVSVFAHGSELKQLEEQKVQVAGWIAHTWEESDKKMLASIGNNMI